MRDPVGSVPSTFSYEFLFVSSFFMLELFVLFAFASSLYYLVVYFYFCYWTIRLSCPFLMFDVSNSFPGRKCGTLQCL